MKCNCDLSRSTFCKSPEARFVKRLQETNGDIKHKARSSARCLVHDCRPGDKEMHLHLSLCSECHVVGILGFHEPEFFLCVLVGLCNAANEGTRQWAQKLALRRELLNRSCTALQRTDKWYCTCRRVCHLEFCCAPWQSRIRQGCAVQLCAGGSAQGKLTKQPHAQKSVTANRTTVYLDLILLFVKVLCTL